MYSEKDVVAALRLMTNVVRTTDAGLYLPEYDMGVRVVLDKRLTDQFILLQGQKSVETFLRMIRK